MPYRLSAFFLSLLALMPQQGVSGKNSVNRTGWQTAREQLRPNYRFSSPSTRLQLETPRQRDNPAFAGGDTLRILAVRVEFKADTLRQTTGDGRFLRTPDARYTIDPPPHNRSYFEAQLAALANYFKNVSRGRLTLQWQVYPREEDRAYELERTMDHYAPGRQDPLSDRRLAELLRDGFLQADGQENLDFAQFDSFILFHAGVGEDFAEDFDGAPRDIPSAFFTLADLRKELGAGDPAYRGIAVRDGAFFITEGIILPEMQSREAGRSGLVEFGLLGTTALMFGHQLGLPNLFSTTTGNSGIGQWGLMDQGSNNYQGLLPAQPCAWSKVFLGWEQPIVVTAGENFDIAAALHQNPNKIYKIPLTDSEYFLLENRQRDVNGDRIAVGRDANGTRIEFKEDSFLAGSTIGVITSVDEYDFGLPYAIDNNGRAMPGCGILIWHIDENLIRANYESNRVNADRDRRGVDLEEADGAQDIGRVYGFLDPGSGSELGVAEDAWWKSNPVITQYLRPQQEVAFGPQTLPSTAANSGANTGITITNFSEIGAVMTFSVRSAHAMPNFPQYAGGRPHALAPLLADLTGNGAQELVVAGANGEIYAWQFNGNKVIANSDSVFLSQPNGRAQRVPAARFAALGDSLYSPPLLVDLNGDGRAEVVAAGRNAWLRAWQARDGDGDGRADLLWELAVNGPVRANLMAASDGSAVYCGTMNGRLLAVSGSGATLWEYDLGTAVRGLALNERSELLVATAGGLQLFSRAGALLASLLDAAGVVAAPAVATLQNDNTCQIAYLRGNGQVRVVNSDFSDYPWFPDVAVGQAPVLGDVDGDGRKEIVAVSGAQLHAYKFNGVLANYFPRPLSMTSPGKFQAPLSPIILDADGDGVQDILATGVEGSVYAYRADGRPVAGLPLALSGPGSTSLAAADLDNDGAFEIAGVSGTGFVHVWRLPGSKGEAAWPMLHHDARQSGFNPQQEQPLPATGTLMPADLVYNYPNPAVDGATRIRYRLNAAARVKITIMDTAGDLVEELTGPGLAQVDNEVEWRVSAVQSGVYLARVEAEAEGQRAVKIIKIAVVK